MINRGREKTLLFINYFNRFIYDHSLYRRRKHFSRYCLHVFLTEEKVKLQIKDCFEINGKQMMPSKG